MKLCIILDGMNTILITLAQGSSGGQLLNVSFRDVLYQHQLWRQNMTIHFLNCNSSNEQETLVCNNFRIVRQKRHLLQKDLCLKTVKKTAMVMLLRLKLFAILFEAMGLPIRQITGTINTKVTYKLDEYNELNLVVLDLLMSLP
jgi:hypothetical protein